MTGRLTSACGSARCTRCRSHGVPTPLIDNRSRQGHTDGAFVSCEGQPTPRRLSNALYAWSLFELSPARSRPDSVLPQWCMPRTVVSPAWCVIPAGVPREAATVRATNTRHQCQEEHDDASRRHLHHRRPTAGQLHRHGVPHRLPTRQLAPMCRSSRRDVTVDLVMAPLAAPGDHRHGDAPRAGARGRAILHRRADRERACASAARRTSRPSRRTSPVSACRTSDPARVRSPSAARRPARSRATSPA